MRRVLVMSLALLFSACEREPLDADVVLSDQSGSVHVPLAAQGDDGSTYALRNSTVEISGSALLTLSPRASDESLSTPLPAGAYTLFLRPGFRVVRLLADGSEQVVDARLTGANPTRFALRPLEDATVSLAFAVDEQRIVFGRPSALRMSSVVGESR